MIQMITCTLHMHRNRWKDLEISEESQPMTTNLRNSLLGSANRIIVKPFNCIPLQELCSGSTWWPQASCFCSWVTRIFFNANKDLLSEILERLSITFTSNGKHKFVPSDQASHLLVIYSSLLLQITNLVSCSVLSRRIVLSCFYLLIFCFENSQIESDVCHLPYT